MYLHCWYNAWLISTGTLCAFQIGIGVQGLGIAAYNLYKHINRISPVAVSPPNPQSPINPANPTNSVGPETHEPKAQLVPGRGLGISIDSERQAPSPKPYSKP